MDKKEENSLIIDYFSSNYEEARKKFLNECSAVGAVIESFKNSYPSPKGNPIFTDVALIDLQNANYILVLGSGTHGVEGFAGSAIQTGLLRGGVFRDLKPDIGVLMIHGINPYGFAHLRRFNEDNVDLNRNFRDHSKPYPSNPGYITLSEAINPKSISFLSNLKFISKLFWYTIKNGKKALKEAISGGQYSHPKGVFFGGTSETWSNKTMQTITSRYLSKAKRVIFIDFHTGLGSFGNAEIILNESEDSPAYKRSMEWWGDRVKTTDRGDSVSVHLKETLKLAFPKFLPNTEVTAVSLEFGTLSIIKVIWALRAENWLHHYGDIEHPDAKRIKDNLLHAFYPDSDEWKFSIWKQGREIVEQALAHLH